MARERILVVDDDATVADVLVRYLERDGYAVSYARDGLEGLELAQDSDPDLVVLDLMLPRLDGLEVCRRLRRTSAVPVIMLTALGEETDRIVGLEVGADDYVTKPFSPRELTLRVRSVLRRSVTVPVAVSEALVDADLVVDVAAHQVRLGGVPVTLTAREYDLLVFLMRNPRQAFSREELLEQVWGWSVGDQSTVTVHVRRLRDKIERVDAGRPRIQTVWGVGYRFDPLTVAAAQP